MSEMKIEQVVSGIAAMAMMIGLAILGLALGESFAHGTAYSEHTLTDAGLFCIGGGFLLHCMMFLSLSRK